ncbi:MAG: DUF559 domain-containing protein, partial [bacterium]
RCRGKWSVFGKSWRNLGDKCGMEGLGVVTRGMQGKKARASRVVWEQAARNRGALTNTEQLLWEQLRGRGVGEHRWHRQAASGSFIFDFYCPKLRMVIEVDDLVHTEAPQQERDALKNAHAAEQGLLMIRIPADMIEGDLLRVLSRLTLLCNQRQTQLTHDRLVSRPPIKTTQ